MRKFLFWTHLAGGVTSGLVIFVLSVTGVILAYEHQIVEWAERSVRTLPADFSGNARLDLGAIVAKAQEIHPGKKIANVTVLSDPAATVNVNFGKEGGAHFMNPYNGALVGKGSKAHDVLHSIVDFHRWLGYKPVGRPITGAATLIFFFLSLTGICIWWPGAWSKQKIKSITQFRRGLTGKARDWNWHNVIGFWSMPILAVISLSGVIMAYPWANNLLYRATGNEPQPSPMVAIDAARAAMANPAPVTAPGINFNALWAAAEPRVPGWYSIAFRLPQKHDGPVNVTILESEWKTGIPRRSQLTLDPVTAEVKKWEPFDGLNAGRKARSWARYLHTGEAGGGVGQTIALIATAGSLVLVWTGIALAWRRFRNYFASSPPICSER